MVSDRIDVRMGGGVRGRVGVELCDADTGRVVQRTERENYVSQRILDVYAEFARFGIVGITNTGNDSADTWMPTNGAFRVAPFTGLLLTDHDGPIDTAERGIAGNVIGRASKGVAGAGTVRGSYNGAESEHRFDYHRFVYDFGTSEANGTIQSVYTGPWDAAGTILGGVPDARLPETIYATSGSSVANAVFTFDPVTATIYRYELQTNWPHNSEYKTVDLESFLLRGDRNSPWQTHTLPTGDFSAMTIVGSRMYWLGELSGSGGSRTLTVYSAPLADPSSYSTEHTWDATFMNSIGWTGNDAHLRGIVWMPDRETFILGNIHVSQRAGEPSAALYEFDPEDNWALVRAFDGNKDSINSALSALPGSPDEIICGDRISRLDNTAGTVTSKGRIQSRSVNATTHTCELSHGMGVTVNAGGTLNQRGVTALIPVQQFFSRARLDEPVVKTSTLTMKITYEFTMDPPVWLP